MARMKKNTTPDDNKFDVRRLASNKEDTNTGKVGAKGKKALAELKKATKSK